MQEHKTDTSINPNSQPLSKKSSKKKIVILSILGLASLSALIDIARCPNWRDAYDDGGAPALVMQQCPAPRTANADNATANSGSEIVKKIEEITSNMPTCDSESFLNGVNDILQGGSYTSDGRDMRYENERLLDWWDVAEYDYDETKGYRGCVARVSLANQGTKTMDFRLSRTRHDASQFTVSVDLYSNGAYATNRWNWAKAHKEKQQ